MLLEDSVVWDGDVDEVDEDGEGSRPLSVVGWGAELLEDVDAGVGFCVL